jgi:hypothetical protein
MSGGVSATTTGPNATQQMNASHSAHRDCSIHTGRHTFLASRMASSYTRLACSRHCETTFHRERSRCSAIRTSAAQNCPISGLVLQHAQLVRAVAKGADKGDVKSDHTGLSTPRPDARRRVPGCANASAACNSETLPGRILAVSLRPVSGKLRPGIDDAKSV